MRIVRTIPPCHGGSAIFSIDIQPGDRRISTGGRAESGDGLVAIWDFKSITEASNVDETCPVRLLCRLENHVGCVNSVRWSESGQYLASAGDDNLVTITQYAGRLASSAENGFSSVQSDQLHQNVELWKCMHTLRGHTGEVLHVAWSPGDVYLASCSIDNQIIIWSGRRFGEKIATLTGHEGLVKGVTWDPVGKYLASQSDDKSLRIWVTSNWSQAKVILDPFSECSATTHVLRLDWSPDGSVIASAHSMNNGGPVSTLIERCGWETGRDLVGHRKAVTCARWSPCFYEMQKPRPDKSPSCVCAIGSKDRGISVWSMDFQRPIFVIQDSFAQSVMDLSWSNRGCYMAACSSDGAIVVVLFSENELGRIMSPSEKASVLSQMYGKYDVTMSLNGYANGHDAAASNSGGPVFIDNPEILKIHQQLRQQEQEKAAQARRPLLNGDASARTAASINSQGSSGQNLQQHSQQRQVEERTKDGKKRIKPIFLGSTVIDETGDEKMTIPVMESQSEKEPAIRPVPVSDAPKELDSGGTIEAVSTFTVTANAIPISEEATKTQSLETAPQSDGAAAAAGEVSVVPKTSSIYTTTSLKGFQAKRKQDASGVQQQSLKKQKQSQSQQRRSRRAVLSDEDEDTPGPAALEKESARDQGIKVNEKQPTDVSNVPVIILPVPAKENNLSLTVPLVAMGRSIEFKIVCQNGVQLVSGSMVSAKLIAFEADAVIWQKVISSEIMAMAVSHSLIAIAGCDRQLMVFKTKDGSVLRPPVMLDSSISTLVAQRNHVMAITSSGSVSLWRFDKSSACLICKESILPLLTATTITIAHCFITNYGAPVLILSDGKSYVYGGMGEWLVLYDPQAPLTAASMPFIRSALKDSLQLDGPLATCHRVAAGMTATPLSKGASANIRGNQNVGSIGVVDFLESQTISAQELRSAEEYKFWLLQYVHHLVREGLASRLRHLCEDLIVSVFECATDGKNEDGKVLGISKEQLLNEIVPMIAKNAKLQRLYGELKEQMAKDGSHDTIDNSVNGTDSML